MAGHTDHTDRTARRRAGGKQLAPDRGLATGTDDHDGAQTNRVNGGNLTRVRVAGVARLVAREQRMSRSDHTHARLECDDARVEHVVPEAQPIEAVGGQGGADGGKGLVDGVPHLTIVSP